MPIPKLRVPSLKVAMPLSASVLPRDLVPMDGPAGEPTLEVALEGTPLVLRMKINGKNYRKLLKQVAEHGADRVTVSLQGVMRPPASPGGPYELAEAGFQVFVKAAQPPELEPGA